MSRPVRLGLILLGVLLFLLISAGLARVLGANETERSAVVDLVDAQARGDANAVMAGIDGCRASVSCRAAVRRNVARLRRPGRVEILQYEASTNLALGSHTGEGRIAWHVGNGLPVVQCARIRRGGDPVSGPTVHVLALSAPIGREASC